MNTRGLAAKVNKVEFVVIRFVLTDSSHHAGLERGLREASGSINLDPAWCVEKSLAGVAVARPGRERLAPFGSVKRLTDLRGCFPLSYSRSHAQSEAFIA